MILVAGGTGRLGTLLVERLITQGQPVRVLTRHRERAAHLPHQVDVVVGDVRDGATVTSVVDTCTTVVSALHGFIGSRGTSPATIDRDGNAKLIDAATAAGADLVLLSVVGAAADSPLELFRMKYAAERHARTRGIPTTVVRSTAFMELWIDVLRQTAVRSGRPLVFGRGDNPVNFVSVADVAALVERALAQPATRGETLEIGGPEDLTLNQLAGAVQSADGRSGQPRHVPPMMLRVMAATVGRVKPQLGRQARTASAMDTDDFTFDATELHRRWPDFPATSLEQVLTRRG